MERQRIMRSYGRQNKCIYRWIAHLSLRYRQTLRMFLCRSARTYIRLERRKCDTKRWKSNMTKCIIKNNILERKKRKEKEQRTGPCHNDKLPSLDVWASMYSAVCLHLALQKNCNAGYCTTMTNEIDELMTLKEFHRLLTCENASSHGLVVPSAAR